MHTIAIILNTIVYCAIFLLMMLPILSAIYYLIYRRFWR